MKKIKRHRIKTENADASASSRPQEEHDLAYYIHDRVELMHQVFSVLKYKELKMMAPECVRNLAVGDLQELCTEELLGISSKRLLAILDGAESPSDTESSSPSPDRMETISLDSISSDEEILSQASKKKRHKHHRSSKSKSKKRKDVSLEEGDLPKASRAGLTVLELLELQARARAIRAQLLNEQVTKPSDNQASGSHHSSDNEVEIKEEAPYVVEISSEDEKPDITALQAAAAQKSLQKSSSKPEEPQMTNNGPESSGKTPTVTRRVSDLIITVPQAKTRKIKLNRSKAPLTIPNAATNDTNKTITVIEKVIEPKPADKSNKRQKKIKKKKNVEKDGSDHDEITLQLSDTEKMDLLEDLNEKNYDKLSSSSADSESSSDSDDNTTDLPAQAEAVIDKQKLNEHQPNIIEENQSTIADESAPTNDCHSNVQEENLDTEILKCSPEKQCKEGFDNEDTTEVLTEKKNTTKDVATPECIENTRNDSDLQSESQQVIESNLSAAIPDKKDTGENNDTENGQMQKDVASSIGSEKESSNEIETEKVIEINTIDDIPVIEVSEKPQSNENLPDTKDKEIEVQTSDLNKEKENKKDASEGELSERESSEVEACEVQPEIVCISDDEKQQSNKKKKKKDKKSKKEKKSKKSKQDFREGSDENFYKDAGKVPLVHSTRESANTDAKQGNAVDITDDDSDVYEILELSDDSSCYEVEGTVLSKEPTAEEIEALSARIDEIKREDVDIETQSARQLNDPTKSDDSEPETEYISWKDRYLGSNKVKRVLTTANIFNALRKKNKELKRKIEESKKKEMAAIQEEKEKVLEEGSIEHYQTLQGSTKYVNPVKERSEDAELKEDAATETDGTDNVGVTKQMKKDAKQLLKMYKKLLKYNDITKKRDPNKKKKRKKKISSENVSGNTISA